MSESPSPKVLRRSTDDGVLGGVSVGLARYIGIDPVIVRIAFIASLFAGGIGVVAYIAAWLLVPDESDKAALSPRRLGGSDDLLKVVGIVLIFFASTLVLGNWSWAGEIIFPLMLVAAGVWLLLRRGEDETENENDDVGSAGHTDADVSVGGPSGTGSAAYATTTLAPPPIPSPRPQRPTGPPVTQITVAMLALAAGGYGLAASAFDGLTLEPALIGGVAITGVGLLVGAFVGRGRPLIVVGILLLGMLSMVSAVDIDLRDGVGERRFAPATISEIEDEYRLGVGEMIIDLRAIEPSELRGEQVRIIASMSAGALEIVVPDGVEVVGRARAGVGDIEAFGRNDDGPRAEVTVERVGPEGAGTITIDAHVGAGEVRVR